MKTTIRLILPVVIIMAVVGGGCPDGSRVVRLISGMEIKLFNNGGGSDKLDVWNTDGRDGSYGKEGVRGAGFGFVCRIENNCIPLAGIQIECQIVSHHDPLDIGQDIWDEYTPNGERYGYVHSLPNGDWDYDEGKAVAYTDSAGECVFLIGLGDPDVGFGGDDDGYLWPDYSGGVSTLVEVRFIIRKASGNIIHNCYMVFFRSQYQNFWEPYGGIFGNSFSSLSPWEGWSKSLDKSGDVEMDLDLSGELELDEVELMRKFPYPDYSFSKSGGDLIITYDPNCPYVLDPNCVWPNIVNPIPDPNCPWTSDPNCMVPDPNCYTLDPDCSWIADSPSSIPLFGEGWEYLAGTWRKWYPWFGWLYVDGMIATWISNYDDPDEIILAMDLSQPYVFLCAFDVDANTLENIRVWSHTGIVRSVDSTGQQISQLPVKLFVYIISGNWVGLATSFILPMEFPEQQGEYHDCWGNSYAAIYVPEGGHLEITKDDFYGDFNFDGKVNNEDYGLFTVRWNDDVFGLYDPNFAYDLMYDADYDGQTGVSDLIEFMDNWLEMR